MPDVLVVGLSSWIIQDGNYGDFSCDEGAAFALEFHASSPLEEFEPDRTSAPSLTSAGEDCYEVVGRVVYVAEDWWAIDVGILMFQEGRQLTKVRQGSWLRGKVNIGVDPFFYFERLACQPGAPAMIYDWKIEKIEVQTAPLIEISPRVMARDQTRLGWREIVQTNAWEDEGEYLLHCIRLHGPARTTRHP